MNKLTQSAVTGLVGGAVVLAGAAMMGQSAAPGPSAKEMTPLQISVLEEERLRQRDCLIVAAQDSWLCVLPGGEVYVVKDGHASSVSTGRIDDEGLYPFNARFPNMAYALFKERSGR